MMRELLVPSGVRVRSLAVALATLLMVGAASAATDLTLLDVAPLPVACEAPGEGPCLVVRPVGALEWREHAGVLQGIDPRTGHGYRLLVSGWHDAGGGEVLAVLEDVPLGDVRWRIESAQSDGEHLDLDPATSPWLRFDISGGRFGGDAGCNSFFGRVYPLAPGELTLGPVASTLMACPGPLMTQERLVLGALEGVENYSLEGERLRLHGTTGSLWLTPLLPERPTAAASLWGDADLVEFDELVADAALAGAEWATDPLRVTLTLLPPWDSAQVDVQRRDTQPEQAPHSVVSLEAGGFLDDSLAGFRRVAVLERLDDGRWRVIATTDAVRCGRGEALWVGPAEMCP